MMLFEMNTTENLIKPSIQYTLKEREDDQQWASRTCIMAIFWVRFYHHVNVNAHFILHIVYSTKKKIEQSTSIIVS